MADPNESAGPSLKLEGPAVNAVISAAILQLVEKDGKDALIQSAINFLLTPRGDAVYGRTRKTPLEDAFNSAIDRIASNVVAEILKTPEMQAKIKPALTAAVEKIFDPARLSEAVSKKIWGIFENDH